MLAQIEEQILQRLQAKGLAVDTTGSVMPAAYVHIEEGAIQKVSTTKLRLDVTVHLTIVFREIRSAATRRLVVYPVLAGALDILTLQDLGLAIAPLVPVGFQNVTDSDDAKAGSASYRIQFRTFYHIEKVDDEAAADLIKVALDYYLQEPADDGVKDAADEISFGP